MTLSINRWNVWAAVFRPNGILTNSNNPKGVAIAVLGMSSFLTGIWWYPLTRSTFENMVHPASSAAKSCTWGIGKVSEGCVFESRRGHHCWGLTSIQIYILTERVLPNKTEYWMSKLTTKSNKVFFFSSLLLIIPATYRCCTVDTTHLNNGKCPKWQKSFRVLIDLNDGKCPGWQKSCVAVNMWIM